MKLKGKLKVLAVGDPAVYAYTDSKNSIVDKFNDQHCMNVDFKIVSFTDYYSTMIQSLEKTHEYDVVMIAGHLWLKDFVQRGFLAKVNYPNTSSYNKKDILSNVLKEMKFNEETYLYPSFCDGHILVYRKSVIEGELGCKLSNVVDVEAISSLAEKSNGVYGMHGLALKAHPSEIFLDYLPYLRNEGVDAFDAKTLQPTFNNKAGITSLRRYINLRRFTPKETITFGNDEIREKFQQKQVAMAVTWGGQLGFIMDDRCMNKEDVGFAAVKTAWNVTWSFAIDKQSPNQKLANLFLAYLTSNEVDRVVGQYAGSPVRKQTYLNDYENYPWYLVHLELINNYAKPLPMMNNSNDKYGPLYEHIYHALVGEQTPEEALEQAEKKILKIDSRSSSL